MVKGKPQEDGYISTSRGERGQMTYQAATYVHGKRCRSLGYVIVPIPEPGYPTEIPPGSVEKLAILSERFDRGELLFHPYDARYEGDPRPLAFPALDEGERVKLMRHQLAHSLSLADIA